MAAIPPDPITEILNNRATIANSVAGIRIHLDQDQDNMEDRLEALLDDSHNREEYLRQELNNTRATILRTRRTYEDAYANEVRHRQHWEVLAQNTQIQLANI
ncbi:unnamed protein product [Rhizophagus irregularis]|nr:unnamed protein product [Rhizophagus irregularis]